MLALPALLLSATLLGGVAAASPSVKLGQATVVGTGDGVVSQFLGIPYAQPP